ncbi:sulfurtransferase-like selenium metabolism protein YedF [Oceanidesulfovibrio marinus]|uniref:Sulfurtransferase-like selenium metabolism protein YedF n=1 Tax=Oceanidesulfovibrio marinus TaxID=370038 RepID=A0ABX6NBY2_9BACT|nr:sulfurtransferase-like selenium metabolism protein YedF [Oceanidesulfovibrio marinus]QJT08100.1 sulfurtransferase-like selenium metabolism protein YedF [Oceanidesulfovibrio marinus]
MNTTLDCKGLACPQPVLRCKRCIEDESPDSMEVVVDNDAARQNVSRYLQNQGYAVEVTEEDGLFRILASREGSGGVANEPCGCEVMSTQELEEATQRIVVFLTADTIGRGDDELGGKLMLNFLSTLPELGETLWRIVIVNGGVRMATKGNPCLEKLAALESDGAQILVCGTCLDHFDLLDQKAVGETTNMLDVVTSLQLATKVLQP